MKLDDFQNQCPRTFDSDLTTDRLLTEYALGLAGEAGEVADFFKKLVFYGKPLDRDALVKEFGDVLWYLSALAILMDVRMSEVAETNIKKLTARYPKGLDRQRGIDKAENASV